MVSGVLQITADNDNLDVSGINVIKCQTSGGNITLGGLTGGIDGQVIYIVKISASNILTIEHNEGVGDQDLLNNDGADYVINPGIGNERGGAIYINHGNGNWRMVAIA